MMNETVMEDSVQEVRKRELVKQFGKDVLLTYHWWALGLRVLLAPVLALVFIWSFEAVLHRVRPASSYFEYQRIASNGEVILGSLIMTSVRRVRRPGVYTFHNDLECKLGDNYVTLSTSRNTAVVNSTGGEFRAYSWGWPVGRLIPAPTVCRTEHLVEVYIQAAGEISKGQIIQSEPFEVGQYVLDGRALPGDE